MFRVFIVLGAIILSILSVWLLSFSGVESQPLVVAPTAEGATTSLVPSIMSWPRVTDEVGPIPQNRADGKKGSDQESPGQSGSIAVNGSRGQSQ